MNKPLPTIGLLYAGEMGASLAALLRQRGFPVVTMADGRSDITRRRCQNAGLAMVENLSEVVRAADIVLSVVPPAAAAEVAEAYASLAHLSPRSAVYVDCNSIGPELAASLARQIAQAGRDFVDVAVHGQARNIETSASLYLAGERAAEIAHLFDGQLRTRVLSAKPGDASAMKMLLGGLSKGLCALFLELAALADRRDMLDELLVESKQFYPGVVTAVERMLPTYPRHAARRIDELRELEKTAIASGQSPCLIGASRRLMEILASIDFGHGIDPADWDLPTLAKHLSENGFLANQITPVEHAPFAV